MGERGTAGEGKEPGPRAFDWHHFFIELLCGAADLLVCPYVVQNVTKPP
ncbi:hypothetical protein ACP4OV_014668 [Aristida adscensionis]